VSGRLEVLAPDGIGEVVAGDDLAALVLRHCAPLDGDVVAVTSKVVSKSEDRVRHGDRDLALAGETARVVARRGPTTIARTHHGLTLAAAGIDASNVAAGHHVLLPVDPDASARRIREAVAADGPNVGVIITDTAGRAWRTGQTDIAIGAAGVVVAESFAGHHDAHGNPLLVTEPAVADELAGAAELASGKLGGRPLRVLRGRHDLVLPRGEHGPGAAALLRPDGSDMFGYGAREAVLHALRGDGQPVFGDPARGDELAAALVSLDPRVEVRTDGDVLAVSASAAYDGWRAAVRTLAFAFGWTPEGAADGSLGGASGAPEDAELRFRPGSP
jgi:coenzyme F420-0:L-glutamate ligase/coenzyme F420-1:gamma-L-glutamate ligase